MTAALLRRSRTFAQDTGRPVRILTFDPELDAARARANLRAKKELGNGVTLHHLWEDVAGWPDEELGVSSEEQPVSRKRARDSERCRTEYDDEGEFARRWHFRGDGSLVALEKRRPRGRTVTLFDRSGRRGRRVMLWQLYRDWFDRLLGHGPTYVVVDSKAMVRSFVAMDRPDTAVVHVVHGAHLASSAADAHGPVSASRRSMVRNVDAFDALVLLTEGQRNELVERVGPHDNFHVIPNSTHLPARPVTRRRDPGVGAVLASLTARKQVDQAIDAFGRAARSSSRKLRLDIYGDGPEHESVAEAAATVKGVTLRGYVPRAADRLAKASFLLLTSRSEGLPLVLAEAMSRGCIPIVYDIRYGPADFITHGVDGFLVPDGDVAGVADCIERLVTLDDEALLAMRRAARATAEKYSDDAVLRRWAETLRAAGARAGIGDSVSASP